MGLRFPQYLFAHTPQLLLVITLTPVEGRAAMKVLQRPARCNAKAVRACPRISVVTPRRVAPISATASKVLSSTAASTALEELTSQIVELEGELQQMFTRGGPMPSATVVNKMREDISNLKIQLSELLKEAQRLEGAAQEETVPENVDLGALDKAKRLLDGVLRMQNDSRSSDPFLAQEMNVEVAMLESENERLREEARQLLQRQQKLEELAAKHGVRINYRKASSRK